MTVVADNKKRVTLPTQPGERFDLQAVSSDQIILTRLAPGKARPAKVTFKKVGGYTVAKTDQPIDMDALNRALDEFP